MKYYAVRKVFSPKGITAEIIEERECEVIPNGSFHEEGDDHIYIDWFDSLEEAEATVKKLEWLDRA